MILNIRGTSGSGKTYAVRQALQHMDPINVLSPIIMEKKQGKARKSTVNSTFYNLQPVYLIGDYTTALCGGADKVSSHDMICSLTRHFSQFGHVIFEGLLISNMYARYAALNEELTGHGEKYVWLFLDTPLEKCIERVLQRRKDRGDERPFDSSQTEAKYRQTWRCHDKAVDLGADVRILDHTNDVGQEILSILDEDARPFSENYREESFR